VLTYKYISLSDEVAAWIAHAAITHAASVPKAVTSLVGVRTYAYNFTRIASSAPYFASPKDIAYCLDMRINDIYSFISAHVADAQQEHKRALLWTFTTTRNKGTLHDSTV